MNKYYNTVSCSQAKNYLAIKKSEGLSLSPQNPATKSYLKQFNPNKISTTHNYKHNFIIIIIIINPYMS